MERVHPADYYIEYDKMPHIIVFLKQCRQYFDDLDVNINGVNLHIPLPLQQLLTVIMEGVECNSPVQKTDFKLYYYGMLVLPGYENRIIASLEDRAIFTDSPMMCLEGLGHKQKLETLEYY